MGISISLVGNRSNDRALPSAEPLARTRLKDSDEPRFIPVPMSDGNRPASRPLRRAGDADRSDHEQLISEISPGECGHRVGSPHGFMEPHMSTPISSGTDASRDSEPAPEQPVVISGNDARQGP